MNAELHFSRRSFLARAGVAFAGLGVFPSIVPASVLGRGSATAPNSRIGVGCIGSGERCQGIVDALLQHKQARVAGICDVKQDALERTRRKINAHYNSEDCRTFGDFREIVTRPEFDAFVIASTDHWHVLHAMAAVRAGKDVYVEKPLGVTLEEGLLLRRELLKRKRVFQFGTQQRSDRKFRIACELVRNGAIGELKHMIAWAPGSKPGGSTRQVPPPATLNYDFWLGPAKERPYTENLTAWGGAHKTWWFNSNFAPGFIAGWGIHPIDIALWGAGDRIRGKVEVSGKGHYPTEGICDTATTWDAEFKFQDGLTMRFVGVPNGSASEKFEQEGEWSLRYGPVQDHGTVFEGTEGWVFVDRTRIATKPETLLDLDPASFKTRLRASGNHVTNFLDCVQSREQTICPIDQAILADAFCHVPDIAMRLNERLSYDIDAERFTNSAAANERLRVRAMRAPWSLKPKWKVLHSPRGVA